MLVFKAISWVHHRNVHVRKRKTKKRRHSKTGIFLVLFLLLNILTQLSFPMPISLPLCPNVFLQQCIFQFTKCLIHQYLNLCYLVTTKANSFVNSLLPPISPSNNLFKRIENGLYSRLTLWISGFVDGDCFGLMGSEGRNVRNPKWTSWDWIPGSSHCQRIWWSRREWGGWIIRSMFRS